MSKRELKQQGGINQALKNWGKGREVRLPEMPVSSEPKQPRTSFVPSTMCELGLIIPIKK